ncbi:MAG: C-terminal binding protein [Clostridia bacterium]
MSRFKIVIADYYYADQNAENEEYKALGDVEIVDCTGLVPGGVKDPEQLIAYAKDADALVVQFARIDQAFINRLEHCKVIARYAIGVDTIDVAAAKAKGICIANVPDYCVPEVADTAAMHILNAVRKLTITRDMLLNDQFDMNAVGPIFRMEDATLALIGFGHIARDLYAKMRAFFARVVAYDPYFTATDSYPEVQFLSLDDALAAGDVVSLHVPLNPHTQGMIGKVQFAAMKDGAILINTARGSLVDEDEMFHALESGKLGFCGLDVVNTEDFIHSRFLRHPRVALTPHVAWRSTEAQMELQRKTAKNVVSALLTGRPTYLVNP